MTTVGDITALILALGIGALISYLLGQRQTTDLMHRIRDALLNKSHVSLEEEFVMTALLAEKLKAECWGKPSVIFAVTPGGCMVAEWLSRRFLGDFRHPIPVCTLVFESVRSGSGESSTSTAFHWPQVQPSHVWPIPEDGRVLVVSDICRGGVTLGAALHYLVNSYGATRVEAATLMSHVDSYTRPRFYAVATDKAVRFDWKDDAPCH